MKTLNLKDVLKPSSGAYTYVMECGPEVDTDLLINSDLFTQSTDGWNVTTTCTSGSSLGRADHRVAPSFYFSNVAGFEYQWMAQG
jgi:hypothetical protein